MKNALGKMVIISCLLILSAVTIYAGETGCPPQGDMKGDRSIEKGCTGKGMEKLKKELNLTDRQVTQMQSLWQRRQEEMKAHRAQTQEKVKGVLTPDQAALWDKQGENFKKDQKARENRRKALMAEMKLTDSQKEQIKAIMKQEKGTFKSRRLSMQNDMKNILTPEQYSKLQEKMKSRQGKGHKGKGGGKGHKRIKGDEGKKDQCPSTGTTPTPAKNPLEIEYK
jgi:Spy/CpxP family protein refolding chaperone